MVHNEGLMMIL